MAGCSAREVDKLVLALCTNIKDSPLDTRDIWERVIVLSIRMKYTSLKCYLNNNKKSIFLSMMKCV